MGKGKEKERRKVRGSGKKWREGNKEKEREEGKDAWRKAGKARGSIETNSSVFHHHHLFALVYNIRF